MFFWRCSCGHAFYPDTLLQTDGITHSSLCTERTCSDTERFVHREAFTHRRFYPQRLSRKEFFTQKLLHTDALHKDVSAQRSIYAQMSYTHTDALHTDVFTQKLLHRDTFAPSSFYTKKFFSPPKKSKQVLEPGSFSFPVVSLPDSDC